MSALQQLDRLVAEAGAGLVPLLTAASLVEYVFPPFPGDTITLIGAMLAVRGQLPLWVVFVACTAGSALGAVLDYLFGVWLGRRLAHPRGRASWIRWLPPERLARVEAQYRRFGPWLILANRFVPVTRALFFVFAGMSQLGLAKTVALGALSAMVFNALLLGVAVEVGANLDRLSAVFAELDRGVVALVGGAALVVALGWWWRRRQARAKAGVQG